MSTKFIQVCLVIAIATMGIAMVDADDEHMPRPPNGYIEALLDSVTNGPPPEMAEGEVGSTHAVPCVHCDIFCEAHPSSGWFNPAGGLVFNGVTKQTVIPRASVLAIECAGDVITVHFHSGTLKLEYLTKQKAQCVFMGIAKHI